VANAVRGRAAAAGIGALSRLVWRRVRLQAPAPSAARRGAGWPVRAPGPDPRISPASAAQIRRS